MKKEKFSEIEKAIDKKQLDKAHLELSKLGPEFLNDPDYLYLRGKIFYLNNLYYLAIDTLFIALEFDEKDKIFNLLSEIYKELGNESFSKKLKDVNLRRESVKEIKAFQTGAFRKNNTK